MVTGVAASSLRRGAVADGVDSDHPCVVLRPVVQARDLVAQIVQAGDDGLAAGVVPLALRLATALCSR